jgi:hypothetical protein
MPDPSPPLSPEVLAALATPRSYPHDPSARAGVQWIQTHISHVFLTGTRVYKFRKHVDLGFVRFAALEQRNADCLREVVLNRRLAPDVYLGVAPLEDAPGGPRVGPAAEDLAALPREHCVVMRPVAGRSGCRADRRLPRADAPGNAVALRRGRVDPALYSAGRGQLPTAR